MNQTPIVNPTREQMRGLKGIIYGIKNKSNNKIYIGQTTRSFKDRYTFSWWKYVETDYLANSISKYGKDAFEVLIFEHSIMDIQELNRLEHEYAAYFDSYVPNGYNLRGCGNNKIFMSEEHRERCSKSNVKTWKFKNIETGEVFDISNLTKFARENNLSLAPLRHAIVSGRGHCHKGYTSIDTTLADIENVCVYASRKYNLPFPPYTVWKKGEKYIFDNIQKFIQEHGMSPLKITAFCDLLSGKTKAYNGFTLMNVKIRSPRQKYTNIKLLKPDGSIEIFESGKDFTDKTGTNAGALTVLMRGEYRPKSYYKLISYDTLNHKALTVV